MTIKTMQEGFALMGATLSVNREDNIVTVTFKGVCVIIDLSLPEKELEGVCYFLNLNIPNWYHHVKEALEEERKGGAL